MDDDIETTLVSVIKEEVVEIKEEFEDDYEQVNGEIKQETLEDCNENNTQGNIGVLGKFYQVLCNGEPGENAMEEDVLSACGQRCPHSKDIEKLEVRVGRLECLLELLVSKVISSPSQKPVTPAVPVNTPITYNNGWQPSSSYEATGSALPSKPNQRSAAVMLGAKPMSAVEQYLGPKQLILVDDVNECSSENPNISSNMGFKMKIVPLVNPSKPSPSFKSSDKSVLKIIKQYRGPNAKTNLPVVDSVKICSVNPSPPNHKNLSLEKPGFVFDESVPAMVDQPRSDLVMAAQTGSLSRVYSALQKSPRELMQVARALLVASTPEVVKALCEHSPEVVNEVEASRALFFAAEGGRVNVLRALLNAGANPNACNRNSLTVLHKAASKDHKDCVLALLQKGARVSATTNCRWTALHMAAISGAASCITALLENGANVDEPDNMGCTALHYASRWDHEEAIQVLLDKGADPKLKNLRGKSPISFCRSETVVKMLTAIEGKETNKRVQSAESGSSKKLKYDVQLVQLKENEKLADYHSSENTTEKLPVSSCEAEGS